MTADSRRSVALLALFVSIAASARAQTVIEIDASKPPSCTGCTIELTRLATLGRAADEEIPTWYSSLTVDSRGRYFLTGADKQRILVYDSTGRYLQQIGRGGQGPGEFRQAISLAVGPGDSLFVVDGPRVSVFAPSLAFARTSKLPDVSAARFIPLSNGALVIPVLTGFSRHYLRLVTPTGDVVRTYAATDSGSASCRTCFMRTVAPGRSPTRFWSTIASRYQLEELSIDGTLLRRITVPRSPWFEPWSIDAAPGLRPHTMLRGAWEDAAGRLWTLGVGPEPNWSPPPPRPARNSSPRGANSNQRPDTALMRQSATVIDVLDPRTGRVVATRRLHGRALHLVAPDRLYEYREDADGFVAIDVWRLSLRER